MSKKHQIMTIVEGILAGSLARKRPDPNKVRFTILAYESGPSDERHVWRYLVSMEDEPDVGGSIDLLKKDLLLTGEDIVTYTQSFQNAIRAVAAGQEWTPCYQTDDSMERANARLEEFIRE